MPWTEEHHHLMLLEDIHTEVELSDETKRIILKHQNTFELINIFHFSYQTFIVRERSCWRCQLLTLFAEKMKCKTLTTSEKW